MTFRVVDLITKLDGGLKRPGAFRMCDASGEDPCGPHTDAETADPTITDLTDFIGEPSGRRDDHGEHDKRRRDDGGRHDECGPGKQRLSLLRDQLRRSLQEPPASPW